MKKINRFVNYFEYDIANTNFDVKAFNDRSRKIKVMIDEVDPVDNINYFLFALQKNKGDDFEVTIQKKDTIPTEFNQSITTLTDKEHSVFIYGFTDANAATHGITEGKETFKANHIKKFAANMIAEVKFQLDSDDDIKQVRLGRAGFEQTEDEEFWDAIKERQLNFNGYFNFINKILYQETNDFDAITRRRVANQGPFVGVREYNLLKYGTAFFMLKKSALGVAELQSYLGGDNILPYYENLSDAYDEALKEYPTTNAVRNILNDDQKLVIERFQNPFFIELIWSYWMEQGMLMQAMSLLNFRFQNINAGNLGQLSRFDLSPLRALSHILWGFIQDEQHRLSLPRRLQEYNHEYGLTITGKSAPPFVASDSRSKFLEAFHNLLTTTSIFYKEADDTTRIADAFPILNSLKEVHLLLAEGNHNAYGNLTWTARHEMMMTQYIFAREEVRQFLGGRPMVPYPERWMDRIDTVRSMMSWGGTSITYFYDLAIHGEKLLLSIRYGNWSDANMPVASAANWAMAFRDSVQKYIHAYRTVTGVDLSADAMDNSNLKNIQPAVLIHRRVLEERARSRRA